MPSDTTVADNAQLGRHFFAEQDRVRGGSAPSLCAPGYRATIGSYPAFDRAGHDAFAVAFYAAFPDLTHTVEDVFATDTRVAVRFVVRGRHTGSFFGIPATGRAIETPAHALFDVVAGKVTRLQAVFDEAGLLRQIGVLPTG